MRTENRQIAAEPSDSSLTLGYLTLAEQPGQKNGQRQQQVKESTGPLLPAESESAITIHAAVMEPGAGSTDDAAVNYQVFEQIG